MLPDGPLSQLLLPQSPLLLLTLMPPWYRTLSKEIDVQLCRHFLQL